MEKARRAHREYLETMEWMGHLERQEQMDQQDQRDQQARQEQMERMGNLEQQDQRDQQARQEQMEQQEHRACKGRPAQPEAGVVLLRVRWLPLPVLLTVAWLEMATSSSSRLLQIHGVLLPAPSFFPGGLATVLRGPAARCRFGVESLVPAPI